MPFYSGALFMWLAIFLAAPASAREATAPERHLTLYGGFYSPNRFIEILQISPTRITTTGDSRVFALALSQTVGHTFEHLKWEVEGQAAQHSGIQTHSEFNAVLVARWTAFPWDHWLDTGFAFGQGLSYATRVPELEPRSNKEENDESNRLLYYLLAEFEFSPARESQWSAIIRVHHRSGVFGKFDDVSGGSNFIGAGVRYRFQ